MLLLKGGKMSLRKGLFTLLPLLLINSLVWSAPVLVKIDFTSQEQVDFAKSLGLKAYQKFDNTYVAEMDDSKLPRLKEKEISWQVVDRQPWSEKYYVASVKRGKLPEMAAAEWGNVILQDSGWRFLKLSSSDASNLRNKNISLMEITKREIPIKYLKPETTYLTPRQTEAKLLNLADSVSQDSLFSYNKRLQDFQTRFIVSDSCIAAANWILNKFKSFGIDSVYLAPFSYFDDVIGNTWRTGYNVVAVIQGKANPDKTIVVGGHYDSVVWGGPYPGSMMDFAPGADDNGSGTAATLEIARHVAKDTLSATMTFVCFSGEELGLWGSYNFAYEQFYQAKDIQFMFNMDMIGFFPNADQVNIERDLSSASYAKYIFSLAPAQGLNAQIMGTGAYSDHWPFLEVGYPAVYAAENVFNYCWHKECDQTYMMNFEYMTKVVKLAAATVENLSNSPRPVENIKIVDNGLGNGVYLSWPANKNENDIYAYQVYLGTQSGNLNPYDFIYNDGSDTFTVAVTSLTEGVTYYIAVAGVNNLFNYSPYLVEFTASSQSLPRAPARPVAQAAYKSIVLFWSPNSEADLGGYRVYRSETSGGPYQLWAAGLTDTTYIDTANIQSGIRYYYVIAAVDTSDNQGAFSPEVSSVAVTLDQGVLVLDETAEILNYGDASQDSFYNSLFNDYKKGTYDYSEVGNRPDLADLGPYNVVVWLDDDQNTHYLLDNFDLLKQYLDAGGKLLVSSWNSFINLPGGLPRSFYPGEFVYDYLKINGAARDTLSISDFAGAVGDATLGYPDVKVDSVKPTPSWNGVLRGVAKIDLRPEAEAVYSYDSKADRPGYEGATCASRYLGADFDVAFLSFPLFYLDFADAQALVTKVMTDFGIPTPVKPEEPPVTQLPREFQLQQNYPNPFNPNTTIKFSLPEASYVKLEVFNILGQKVKNLLNEKKNAGVHTVVWNGDNQNGERVSSGIYFYRLETESYGSVKKMVLLR
jgi:hypothetical protein